MNPSFHDPLSISPMSQIWDVGVYTTFDK